MLLPALPDCSHFFGGPLPHHYLYVSGSGGSGGEAGADSESSSASAGGTVVSGRSRRPSTSRAGALFAPKNNRSASFNSLLHQLRSTMLGDDESARPLALFRRAQQTVWRAYKALLRRICKTGELERMIINSGISMLPSGNTHARDKHPDAVMATDMLNWRRSAALSFAC